MWQVIWLFTITICYANNGEKIDLEKIWKVESTKPCMSIPMKDIHQRISKNVLYNAALCGTESLGNMLSNYVESMLCANLTGMHVVSLTKSPPEHQHDRTLPDFFPRYVYNPAHRRGNPKITCQCTNDICHEHPNALIHSHPSMVRDLLRPIIIAHYDQWLKEPSPLTRPIIPWKSTVNHTSRTVGTDNASIPNLPLVPEVAVHYRCGDNTVGHYGFLSFPAMTNRIPPNATTIYVMAEASSRNGNPERM